VILTLTPIIFYIGRHANINILPYLFVQFFGANTLSMFLYIGNPTNIIIGNALGFGFLRYTQIMWLPTFVATLANFILLFIIFRKQITRHYTINEQSKVTNHNPFFTSISLAGLALMLLSLAISQNMHWDIWEVTLFFAILFFFLHLFRLLFYPSKQSILGLTIHRMPWKILPFITVFFIYVQSLLQYGFVDNLAEISSHFSKNLFSGIFINGFSGIILANIINNQPMTILFSSVFVSKSFCVAENVFLGSAYAVIIASNLAANITLMGALAGMMWKKILGDKGLCISYWDFLKKGLLITPLVFFLTLLTLYFVLI
jgi:arsenical pump membrane protein